MKTDLDQNIVKIRYNILNLPDTVQFSNGNQIVNLYSADGRKLGTEYFTQVTNLAVPLITGVVIKQAYTINVIKQNGTAYVDNKEYTTSNGNTALTTFNRLHNPEGYVYNLFKQYGAMYCYNRKDHLGNIREVWRATGYIPSATEQLTQYFPSGLPWASNQGDVSSAQPYKYNGKEFVEMHGFDTYDYGARGYYPASGRFTTVDPLAEMDYSISPYAYCAGNPVNNVDPFGLDVWSTSDPDEIRVALESLKNRSEIKINDNSNWSYKSDQQFLKDNEDEGYSQGLNFRKGKLYFGSSPSKGAAGIQIKDLGSIKLDLGDCHFSPDGSYYNLYTANENKKAFRFSMNVALTLLLGPAVQSLGLGAVTASALPKAANIALKAAIKAPAAANAIKTMGNGAMIFLAQKTFSATVVAAGAGAIEGSVKSYFGGPDTEMSSSMFLNPASDAGMNGIGVLWNILSLPTNQ